MDPALEQHQSDDGVDLAVYLSLLALTGVTLAAGHFSGHGRLLAVSIAMIIATAKASLIGFYFMGLRRERLMTFIVLAIGLLAVLALLIGIYPDMAFSRL